MAKLHKAGGLLLLALALESPLPAQVPKPAKGAGGDGKPAAAAFEQPAQSPLQIQARQLIGSTADEAHKWDDAQAAVRVLSRAADLLWDEDPGRARAWLMRTWEASGKVRDKGDSRSGVQMRGTARSRARSEILSVAQERDAKLARQLLDALAEEKEEAEEKSRRGPFDDRTARSEQLLNLALSNVEKNPALAESLAERSLADGISFRLQEVLLNLRQRDPRLADRLFDAALSTLATSFSQPGEGQVLASYLFTPGRTLGVDANARVTVSVNPLVPALDATPAQADPARARRFLTIMQQRLLAMPAPSAAASPAAYAQEFVTLLRPLARAYQAYAPDLWTPLAQRLAQFTADAATAAGRQPASQRPAPRALDNSAPLDEAERHLRYIEHLEEAADAEADPVARKLAYLKAAMHTSLEEIELGRKIASKIEEKELREQVISFLVYRVALDALEKKRVEEAVGMASEVKPIQRAIVLITAAQTLGGHRPQGEAEWQAGVRGLRALELLSEAEKILKGQAATPDVLRVRLGLVTALARTDSARAYDAMNETVRLINEMKSNDFMDASAPRVTELDEPTARLLLPHVGSGYGVADAFAALARADFNGSVQAANRLSSQAGRGLVLLEIGRSLLETKAPKRQSRSLSHRRRRAGGVLAGHAATRA